MVPFIFCDDDVTVPKLAEYCMNSPVTHIRRLVGYENPEISLEWECGPWDVSVLEAIATVREDVAEVEKFRIDDFSLYPGLHLGVEGNRSDCVHRVVKASDALVRSYFSCLHIHF